MAENTYAEGTLEWHAWGAGNDYRLSIGDRQDDAPLSGEWADGPTPCQAIVAAWQGVLGKSWDTYNDGTPDDRDWDDAILDAWEAGYEG